MMNKIYCDKYTSNIEKALDRDDSVLKHSSNR